MKLKRFIRHILAGAICFSLAPGVIACADSPPVITDIKAEAISVHAGDVVRLTCQASDHEGDVLEYVWSASGGDIVSESPEAAWSAPEQAGAYTISVLVRDGKGNEADGAITMYVAENLPPRIDSLLVEPSAVGEGQQCFLKCGAADPEGEALTFTWEAEKGSLTGSGPTVSWLTPFDETNSVIKVTVADPQGHTATMTVNVSILPNQDPEIEMLTATPRNMTPGVESILQCVASDADGDSLEYSWEVNGGMLEGSGADVSWIAPEECGTYTVTVTVTDGRHGVAVKQLLLRVAKTGG